MRPEPARKAFARARRLAKRPPDVQQTGGLFPADVGRMQKQESRRNPAAFSHFDQLKTGAVKAAPGRLARRDPGRHPDRNRGHGHSPVSYTHLDVYKRQALLSLLYLADIAVFWFLIPDRRGAALT